MDNKTNKASSSDLKTVATAVGQFIEYWGFEIYTGGFGLLFICHQIQ